MIIDGVKIHHENFPDDDQPSRDELAAYVNYVKARVEKVSSITVTYTDGGEVSITWTAHDQPFERIRRITGYLVGTIDRWNDAKQAEERDRVKHEPKL